MTRYQKGRSWEYRIKRILEKEGYMVIRSAGSHTPVDLIALRAAPDELAEVILIQACSTGVRQRRKALTQLPYGLAFIRHELWIKKKRGYRREEV